MIDNIEFIEEVKQRPGIWNYKSEEYSSKVARSMLWEQICEKFVDDFAQKSVGQKFEAVLQFQRKWKSLRDSYSRYRFKIKKAKTSGEFASPKLYTYAPYLTFLSTLKGEKTNSSSENSDIEATVEETRKRKPPPAKTKLKKLSKQMRKNETSPISDPEHDEDKLFLLSLLSDFKKVSDDLKLDAKVEIMEIIKKYKQSSMGQSFVYVETCKQSQSDYDYTDM
ncbi:hypothetical protein K1T71_014611 [Dendrolimus kikuchii]|uniref:Uncharacterized protein n=1 Tax=Dendrolimus kikuchii TaxID=765133 RepID=A0ACC1CET1_9NEOP|nr:hypothetical protein K1T71_014611 [Dendrolimus kikuchii]